MHGTLTDTLIAVGMLILLVLSFKEPPRPPTKLG